MPDTPLSNTGLRKLASYASLTVAVALTAIKLAAWLATGSVAMLTSAVDALVDSVAAVVTLLGVRYASQPPDRKHRFGHGKAEAVAGFTQANFVAGAACVLAFQALQRLFSPQPLARLDFGVWVIVICLIAALALTILQGWVVKRTNSTAIAADRAHYLADVAVNAGVLAALLVTKLTGWTRADPVFALALAGYMLWSARHMVQEALTQLLDQELPSEDRARIKAAILACPDVRALHDLRTRYAGDRSFVEFHLEVDGTLTVARGHDIVDQAEAAVVALLPGTVEVIGHMEPSGIIDDRLDAKLAPAQE
jgi:cation diffusion facilitator family transporter